MKKKHCKERKIAKNHFKETLQRNIAKKETLQRKKHCKERNQK